MSESSQDRRSFIQSELRPQVSTGEVPPTLSSAPPQAELRKHVNEALGPMLKDRLGVSETDEPEREQVYGQSPDVVATVVEGEAVLLDLRSGRYFSLNKVGTAVWEQMDGKKTLEVVLGAICQRFAVKPEAAWKDMTLLVRELRREKLLVEIPAVGKGT